MDIAIDTGSVRTHDLTVVAQDLKGRGAWTGAFTIEEVWTCNHEMFLQVACPMLGHHYLMPMTFEAKPEVAGPEEAETDQVAKFATGKAPEPCLTVERMIMVEWADRGPVYRYRVVSAHGCDAWGEAMVGTEIGLSWMAFARQTGIAVLIRPAARKAD